MDISRKPLKCLALPFTSLSVLTVGGCLSSGGGAGHGCLSSRLAKAHPILAAAAAAVILFPTEVAMTEWVD